MFKLVISDDEGKTTTVPLVRDEITIGRKEGNTIRLTDRNVSRRHARLQKQNGHYLLHDLGSYNGIVINGTRLVEVQPIKHGDQILIGDYKLNITEEATSQINAPPPGPGVDTLDAAPTAIVAAPGATQQTAPSIPSAKVPPPPPPPAGMAEATLPMAVPAPPISTPPASEAVPEHIRELRLVFLAPAGAPSPVNLERLPLILGRSEAADIALPYSSISREHARLSVQGGALIVEDLGSSNGVMVNGNKAPRSALQPGDLVTLGVVEFRVARRGDNTVVLNTDDLKPKGKKSGSPVPILAGVLGLVVVVGGGLFAMHSMSGGSHTAPPAAATAPELSAANTAPPAPSPAQPAAVAGTNDAPQNGGQAATPQPAQPEHPEVAQNDTNEANGNEEQPSHASANSHGEHTHHASEHSSSSSGSSGAHASSSGSSSESHQTVVMPPSNGGSHTQSNSSTSNTASSSNSGGSTGGGSPLAEARACRGDNQCILSALGSGRAQTEPEVGMLAVTYRLMGNRAQATRVMNQYLRRWPSGPRSEGFRSYVEGD